MDWWIILLSIIFICLTQFYYFTMTYFKKTKIPHELPLPVFGNMLPVVLKKRHFVEQIQKFYKRWPKAKYIGYYDCLNPVIIVRDVELIKSLGIRSFEHFMDRKALINVKTDPLFGKSIFGLRGNEWKKMRTFLTPAFTGRKMRLMYELVSTCSKHFSDYMIARSNETTTDMEIKEEFTKYTNDVIADCIFGHCVNSVQNPENECYDKGRKLLNFTAVQIAQLFLFRFWPKMAKMMKLSILESETSNYFINLVKQTIDLREENGISRPDLLQQLIDHNKTLDNKLDITEITAQVFTFYFAGLDTSSSLMSYAAIALSLNPEVQNELLQEIDQVNLNTNDNPTYEDINKMVYLAAFLFETLRYYPIVGVLERMCTSTYELPPAEPGLKPFLMKPGMNIWIPSYGIHTDPNYFNDPEVFNPDRFLDTKITTNMPTYMPFGIGPRSCIGTKFALMECKLVLFHILTKSKFELSPKLKLPIKFRNSNFNFTTAIQGGFWIKIVPRSNVNLN